MKTLVLLLALCLFNIKSTSAQSDIGFNGKTDIYWFFLKEVIYPSELRTKMYLNPSILILLSFTVNRRGEVTNLAILNDLPEVTLYEGAVEEALGKTKGMWAKGKAGLTHKESKKSVWLSTNC